MLFDFMTYWFYFGGAFGWYITSNETSKFFKLWNSLVWPWEVGAELAAWQVKRNEERVKNV